MRTLLALTFLLAADPASAQTVGPAKGSLVIVGGGRMGPEIVKAFLERAGGKDAPFVIIPTANVGEDWGPAYIAKSFLAKSGAKDVVVLHTRDPKIADTDEFVAPLKRAKGVWFDGGRQWRLTDAYLNTKTQ